jgi:RNA polymerase sigma-70 factor (ECF subfamily)
MLEDPPEIRDLLAKARGGDDRVLGQLLLRFEPRLRRILAFHLDPRLRARLDESDVLQEAFLEASQRFRGYVEKPDMPFFLWVRFIACQRLDFLHRYHLGAKKRDARREKLLGDPWDTNGRTSAVLARNLLGRRTSPTQAAVRAESRKRIQEALEGMEPIDREVLVLRHFEQLTNAETARALGIQVSAASKRYMHALRAIKKVLEEFRGHDSP